MHAPLNRLGGRLATHPLMKCPCGASGWNEIRTVPLPDDRSITTDGHLIRRKLTKGQCPSCGLLRAREPLDAAFYAEDYAFYSRPGAESFDAGRYRAMAQWICDAIGDLKPQSVAEIGCGNGWTLRAMRELLPGASFTGLEPSARAAKVARQNGFEVIRATVGVDRLPPDANFDLVYSNNVINRTVDPLAFLIALRPLLAPGGRIAVSCPDGTLPAADMMFADHLWTFAPRHLVDIVKRAGYSPLGWGRCPAGTGLRNEQIVVACAEEIANNVSTPTFDAADMERERERYFARFGLVDSELHAKLLSNRPPQLYCFGAGEWAHLLAGYAPRRWAEVMACTVDGYAGTFMGKDVTPFAELPRDGAAIIVGTNPDSQRQLADRLVREGYRPVIWYDLVER